MYVVLKSTYDWMDRVRGPFLVARRVVGEAAERGHWQLVIAPKVPVIVVDDFAHTPVPKISWIVDELKKEGYSPFLPVISAAVLAILAQADGREAPGVNCLTKKTGRHSCRLVKASEPCQAISGTTEEIV